MKPTFPRVAIIALITAPICASLAGAQPSPAMASSVKTAKIMPDANPEKAAIVQQYIEALYIHGVPASSQYLAGHAANEKYAPVNILPNSSCSVLEIDALDDRAVTHEPSYLNEMQISAYGKCQNGKIFLIDFFVHNAKIEEITDISSPAVPPPAR